MSELTRRDEKALGMAANAAAARHAFEDYRRRKAPNTVEAQDNDLKLFAECLGDFDFQITGSLSTDAHAWEGITWGLVKAFSEWMLGLEYSITSVNRALSTVRVYAKLAAKAGVIPPDELVLIKDVNGYSRTEGRHIDEYREAQGLKTRITDGNGNAFKKAESVEITQDQAEAMKTQAGSNRNKRMGARDRFLMCLVLDHGLREGEVALLKRKDVNMTKRELHFFRPKVSKMERQTMSKDTYQAALVYFQHFQLEPEDFLIRTLKRGLVGGLSERGIIDVVRKISESVGVIGFSPHDGRNYWATLAADAGTDLRTLQEAGGWASLEMPRRYIKGREISNHGIKGVELVERGDDAED